MDIISLGKASKTLREIKDLDEGIVGKKAESHFKTVDERLDWIESQADKVIAINNIEIDLSKGVFDNTELVDGKIKLKKIGTINTYPSKGKWESSVLDLGEGWKETKLVDVVKQVKSGEIIDINIAPIMTSNTTPEPYVVSRSGVHHTRNEAWNLFDRSGSYYYSNTIPAWVSIDMSKPIVVGKYTITKLTDSSYRPNNWEFQGSNDNINWITLDSILNHTQSGKSEFVIANENAYRYYRIYVTKVSSGPSAIIVEMELMERKSGANIDVEISTSMDGHTFSEYTSLDPSEPPQARYVKIRATLSATPLPAEVNIYEFDQGEDHKVAENEWMKIDGDLSLKKEYTYTSEDSSLEEDGKIIQTRIPASKFKQIRAAINEIEPIEAPFTLSNHSLICHEGEYKKYMEMIEGNMIKDDSFSGEGALLRSPLSKYANKVEITDGG